MSELHDVINQLPELRLNQIGVSCKTFGGGADPALKLDDEILYFTINRDTVAMELYPKKPVIIIDRDAVRMILLKIAEVEATEKIKSTEQSQNDDRFPLDINQESQAMTAQAEPGADSNELNDLQNFGLAAEQSPFAKASADEGKNELKDVQNEQEVEAGKAAILSADDAIDTVTKIMAKMGNDQREKFETDLLNALKNHIPDKDGIF